jgi:hypothetical protein
MSLGTGGLGLIAWAARKKTSIKNSPNLSVSQETDGRKRPASPEEEGETRKRRPEECGSIELSSSSSDESMTEESTAAKALAATKAQF